MQSQIQIQILTVEKVSATTTKGDSYHKLEVNYKDLTNGNKVAKKLVMPFGSTKGAHQKLSDAKTSDVYDITQVKNDKGYLDWTGATQAAPGAPARAVADVGLNTGTNALTPAPARTNNSWESAEERAAKQVLIVKQSSLSAAVATLTAGTKSAIDPERAIELAQRYTDFVFGKEDKTVDLFNTPSDLDDDIVN